MGTKMSRIELGKIVPRWEWRTFGDDFGSAEENIQKHECTRVLESSEIYFLSRNSDQNIKVRDDLMDIKILKEINSDALEQWFPVMKASFPIETPEIREVLLNAKVELEVGDDLSLSLEDFIAQIIDPNPNLKAVGVFKKRYGYIINEAVVELADLTIDGKPIRTTAVEHADEDLVISVVKDLGLYGLENVNYIQAMKRLVTFEG